MSRDPSGNVTGGGGLSGYTGNPDLRTPALGRSSRDLASDSGPAGASEELFGTGDRESELLTGRTGEPAADPDAADRTRPRKLNPEIDPDTRMGLRPAIAAAVEPDRPSYPVHAAGTRGVTGAAAGAIGAAVLAAILYTAFWTGIMPAPNFVAAERAWLGARSPALDHLLGAAGFLLAGALWGALFGLIVSRPTVLKGMAFGLLPTLFLWLVMAPALGQPAFNGFRAEGILLPILFNVLIWGTILGYLCSSWLRPPYASATVPDATGE